MIRKYLGITLLFAVCTVIIFLCFYSIASAQEAPATRPAHIGLFYPVSTNGTGAAAISNDFSFHVFAGVSRDENAFCLSGLTSIVKGNARGVLISGISGHVGREASGLQLAGIVNQIKGRADGLQVAGITNMTGGGNSVQVAGLVNVAQQENGVQLSGLLNKAGDVNTQIAGLLNIAKKVKGLQIAGLLNIAEESDYPVGLINLIKNGEKQVGVSLDETGSTVIAFRSGGSVLYGIVGAGYNFRYHNARYVLETGIGAHIPVWQHLRLDLEISECTLSDIQNDVYFKSTAGILAGYKIPGGIELFAGPTINQIRFDRSQPDILHDNYLWSNKGCDNFNGLYIGVKGGINITL